MPRYNLEFCVDASSSRASSRNKVRSNDFAAYHIAPTPQLDDTLMGFTQYLVLTPDEDTPQAPWCDIPVKVIVPKGVIPRCFILILF